MFTLHLLLFLLEALTHNDPPWKKEINIAADNREEIRVPKITLTIHSTKVEWVMFCTPFTQLSG